MAEPKPKAPSRGVRRIPQQSFLYQKILPVTMIVLGLLLVAIVLFAAGILLGVVQFK